MSAMQRSDSRVETQPGKSGYVGLYGEDEETFPSAHDQKNTGDGSYSLRASSRLLYIYYKQCAEEEVWQGQKNIQ